MHEDWSFQPWLRNPAMKCTVDVGSPGDDCWPAGPMGSRLSHAQHFVLVQKSVCHHPPTSRIMKMFLCGPHVTKELLTADCHPDSLIACTNLPISNPASRRWHDQLKGHHKWSWHSCAHLSLQVLRFQEVGDANCGVRCIVAVMRLACRGPVGQISRSRCVACGLSTGLKTLDDVARVRVIKHSL